MGLSERQLQRDFEGKIFNLEGVKRECYYCTLENGGAWIWLQPNINDKCDRLNFIIYDEYKLEQLHNQVKNKEKILISDYGYLNEQM